MQRKTVELPPSYEEPPSYTSAVALSQPPSYFLPPMSPCLSYNIPTTSTEDSPALTFKDPATSPHASVSTLPPDWPPCACPPCSSPPCACPPCSRPPCARPTGPISTLLSRPTPSLFHSHKMCLEIPKPPLVAIHIFYTNVWSLWTRTISPPSPLTPEQMFQCTVFLLVSCCDPDAMFGHPRIGGRCAPQNICVISPPSTVEIWHPSKMSSSLLLHSLLSAQSAHVWENFFEHI